MAKRGLVLSLILVLRVVIGGWLTSDCVDGQKIRLAGIISEIEHTSSKQIIRVGHFLVENNTKSDYFRGQSVAVIGRCQRRVIDFFLNRIRLIEPKIEVDTEKILARTGWWSAGINLQKKLAGVYQRQLPEPEASLVAGIVLGAKANLPKVFYDALINTGTIHVVVASGYNLTVVAEVLFYILIYFVSRKWATMGVVAGMLVYAWMTGWGVPVVRALILGTLVLISRTTGRTGTTGWWLVLTVWGLLMWSPEMAVNVSFQLSVAATAGLVFGEPKIRKMLSTTPELGSSPPKLGGDKRGGIYKMRQFVLGTELVPTLSAQIMTAPIIWWHFGRLSLISPLVNLLVLPLIPPAMLLGVLQLWLGVVIAPFSYALLHLIVVIINIFGG